MGNLARDGIPLESTITNNIQRYLKRLPGWWGFKVMGGAQQKRGVPDIIGCYRGRFVGLEVKRPVLGRVSDLQEAIIEQINAVGGCAVVVYGVDDVKQVIAALDAALLGADVFAGGGDD